jgi:hypothetical protein
MIDGVLNEELQEGEDRPALIFEKEIELVKNIRNALNRLQQDGGIRQAKGGVDDLVQTVDHFHVSNINDDEAYLFTELKDLYTGQNDEVKSDKIEIYYRLLESIGNIDIAKAILDLEFGCDPLSVSNAMNRMGKKHRLCVDCSVEEEFVASKFFQFSGDSLNELKCEYWLRLVKPPSLQLSSEDSLLQVISTFELSPCRDELLSLVECEFLSCDGIEKYLTLISLSSINNIHWQSICRRLRHDVHPVIPTNRLIREWIEHKPGSDFEGILCHLKGLHSGNIRSAVSIDVSSCEYGDPYDVTNYGSQINWYTRNKPNSWLQFNFKDRHVSMNSYTIKSQDGNCIPRSWVIEGRNCDTDLTGTIRTT